MSGSRIPAVYMRGGTSKGLFFRAEDLPTDPAERDAILLRAIGSPDPFGKQIDGMGGATSSTSKIVILCRSVRADSDVDYRFGQVAIDRPLIDWSGNCGNLTSAVGPFAISEGWVVAPRDGIAEVRIWQANIGKRIVAHVPVRAGEVVEEGDFVLDGVPFPAAEIRIEFLDPGGLGDAGAGGVGDAGAGAVSNSGSDRLGEAGGATAAMFPTGSVVDTLDIAGVGPVQATLITAGNPTVFIDAAAVGLEGAELPAVVDADAELLARCEAIRAHASVRMGLAGSVAEASRSRPHTPKLAMVSCSQAYTASNGKAVHADDLDLTIRMVSMGRLHHAITGTGAIATAVASAIEGTIPHAVRRPDADDLRLRLGHPSGTMTVGAEVAREGRTWNVARAVMSRSARRLMEGWVRVPSA